MAVAIGASIVAPLGASGLVGCGAAADEAAVSHQPSASAGLILTRSNAAAPTTKIPALTAGRFVYRGRSSPPVALGLEVIAAVSGTLSPVAIPADSDARAIVYQGWEQISDPRPSDPKRGVGQGLRVGDPVGVPSVRIFDTETDRDAEVAEGAYSPAVALDGRLAYTQADSPIVRQNLEYVGNIIVRKSPSSPPTSWTSNSARYFPYAWAGSTLLTYRSLPDSEAADLYAYMGPGQAHLLARDAQALAISPDATKVLLSVGGRRLELVRIKDAAITASLPRGRLRSPGLPRASISSALTGGGDWYQDRVVLASDRGLVLLKVGDALRVEAVTALPPSLPNAINEPHFIDQHRIVGWADVGEPRGPTTDEPAYKNALVLCDIKLARCELGNPAPPRDWMRWVVNPSA